MNVVIADDDATARMLVERLLQSWGYTTLSFSQSDEALTALLNDDSPKIAVLDWMMPGLDGIEIARRLRAEQHESYTYIVLITAKNHRSEYLQALAAGADDFLSKPFDPQELKARLHVGQRILTLQSGLRFQATHDQLTGLLNRAAVLRTLDEELARASREKNALSLIMADIDHFKKVNDTYGHLAGDDVIREVAYRMRFALRSYDKLGRFGGEEFLIITPGADAAAAVQIAERTRKMVGDSPIQTSMGEIKVTISLGVSSVFSNVRDALHAADVALYSAKRAGRNSTMAASGDPGSLSEMGIEGQVTIASQLTPTG